MASQQSIQKLQLIFLDFETYWDRTHSLTKLNPIAYVLNHKTEILSCAIKLYPYPTQVILGETAIHAFFNSIDWSQTYVIGHNLEGFDSLILAWRFGVKPKRWGCTLAMSRPFFAKAVGGSLKALAEYFQLGVKDKEILFKTQGKHLIDFTSQELELFKEYNCQDVELCCELFKKLLPQYSKDELDLIDLTVRMLVEPQLELDISLLEQTLEEEYTRKEILLNELAAKLCTTRDLLKQTLMSNPKFADLLQKLGVEPPKKISPTTGRSTYAFAKTDQEFISLTEHENELVSLAARTRLDVKSTLLETRLEAFLEVGKLTNNKLPIPLKYCGADTTWRWSGYIYNVQNLPRISKDTPKLSDTLRNSIVAPSGYLLIVIDLSSIELRVNHFLWQVSSSMQLFSKDPQADLYRAFAAIYYQTEPENITKEQRHLAKIMQLALGYGMGAAKFQATAKQNGLELTLEEAEELVQVWRETYSEITQGWERCQQALRFMSTSNTSYSVDSWGLIRTKFKALKTPKGRINYPNLQHNNFNGEYTYMQNNKLIKIYGGKLCENIVQHLARCVLADQVLKINQELDIRPALLVHDEFVGVVKESEAEKQLEKILKIMRTPPEWWPELVVWADGAIARRYGEAK